LEASSERREQLRKTRTLEVMSWRTWIPAVLLCDNCSSHIDDEIMQLLVSHNIKLLTFPLQPSDMFQPLDLVIVEVLTMRNVGLKLNCQLNLRGGASHDE
jgi:hypothetical protein